MPPATARRAVPAWYRWFNLGLNQAAWFVAVFSGEHGRSWPGVAAVAVVAGCELGIAPEPGRVALRLACAVVLGFAVDAVLGSSGLCCWRGGGWDGRLPPPWLTALWPSFATLLTNSLAWLQPRLGWSALLGALGAPLAYAGGARMGALAFPAGMMVGLLAIAMLWALATPILAFMARFSLSTPTEAAHA
jgi:hypothetical protein